MAMQHTPLLMSNILDRGAKVAPNEEIVTATETGVRRQTYKETRDRAHQLAHALRDAGVPRRADLVLVVEYRALARYRRRGARRVLGLGDRGRAGGAAPVAGKALSPRRPGARDLPDHLLEHPGGGPADRGCQSPGGGALSRVTRTVRARRCTPRAAWSRETVRSRRLPPSCRRSWRRGCSQC